MPMTLCEVAETFPVGARIWQQATKRFGVVVSAAAYFSHSAAPSDREHVGSAFIGHGNRVYVATRFDGSRTIGNQLPEQIELAVESEKLYTQADLDAAVDAAITKTRRATLNEAAAYVKGLR